jgi:hypothetical protein
MQPCLALLLLEKLAKQKTARHLRKNSERKTQDNDFEQFIYEKTKENQMKTVTSNPF